MADISRGTGEINSIIRDLHALYTVITGSIGEITEVVRKQRQPFKPSSSAAAASKRNRRHLAQSETVNEQALKLRQISQDNEMGILKMGKNSTNSSWIERRGGGNVGRPFYTGRYRRVLYFGAEGKAFPFLYREKVSFPAVHNFVTLWHLI